MMKMIRPNLLVLVGFALLVTACSSEPEAPSVEDPPAPEIPEVEIPEEIPLDTLVDPRGGEYEFSMTAIFGDLEDVYADTYESEWLGSFTVDDNGNIEGEGSLYFEARSNLLSNITNNCGYWWSLKGNYKFDIGGTLLTGQNNIPMKISTTSLFDANNPDPMQFCPSELDSIIHLPQFSGHGVGRRDAMFDAILGQFNIGFSNILYADSPFHKKTAVIEYTINIKYVGPTLENLDQNN